MNIFGIILGDKKSRTWFIVTASLLVFFLVLSIMMETLLLPTLQSSLGARTQSVEGGGTGSDYFTSDYENKTDALAKSNALTEEISEEGFVLLKNEGNALPLANGARVSIFGKNSVNLVYGGSGSGRMPDATIHTGLYDSLEDAGFVCNPTLKSFYEDNSASGSGRGENPSVTEGRAALYGFATGETPQSSYTSAVKNSYANYNDAAIVVVSRISGESFDLPRAMEDTVGAVSEEDHYLELDKNEQDMIIAVCNAFSKVILIVNSNSTMELGFLDALADNDTTQDANIDSTKIQAAIWIGGPGAYGINALGRVLNGEVNPSGKTVDTYQRDFTLDPTYANFAENNVANGASYISASTSATIGKAWFIDYEEGIYLGYRYYETRGYTDGEAWYNSQVVYPFGYGLSYTTFTQEIVSSSPADNATLSFDAEKNSVISVTVEVKNVGAVAGKEVVQVYCTAPYVTGQIEKAHVVLCGYAKTGTIQPGQSENVTVSFDAYTFASYDYDDSNGNNFKGYELDAGNYEIKVMANAHTALDSVNYTVGANVQYGEDTTTGATVGNLFDDVSNSPYGIQTELSRADWVGTFPQTRTTAQATVDAAFETALNSKLSGNPLETTPATEMPTQSRATRTAVQKDAQLYLVIDTDEATGDAVFASDGSLSVDYENVLWDKILDTLSVSQMKHLVGVAGFRTDLITTINKPATGDFDGPGGFVLFLSASDTLNTVYDTCYYTAEVVLASTWNLDLAERMGVSVGNEALVGNVRGDGRPYSGWYAPAVNLHRSPFSGRNYEYYSEDGLLSGKVAAKVINGVMSKGVYTMLKHFAVNDQETNRNGVCTWLSEQSLREVYVKSFEIAVKEGKTTGVMSSFNRIGTTWAGGSYALLTSLLREEWGFKGGVICDFNIGATHMNVKQMLYAGGDLNLSNTDSDWAGEMDATNASDVTVLRQCTKNILYMVSKSNAMNGMAEDSVITQHLAWWETTIFVLDGVLVAGLAVWGVFAIKGALKRKKEADPIEEGTDIPKE